EVRSGLEEFLDKIGASGKATVWIDAQRPKQRGSVGGGNETQIGLAAGARRCVRTRTDISQRMDAGQHLLIDQRKTVLIAGRGHLTRNQLRRRVTWIDRPNRDAAG